MVIHDLDGHKKDYIAHTAFSPRSSLERLLACVLIPTPLAMRALEILHVMIQLLVQIDSVRPRRCLLAAIDGHGHVYKITTVFVCREFHDTCRREDVHGG